MERTVEEKNRRLLKIMLVVAVLMFGFGFALVPMYNVLCKTTGLNGKTSGVRSNLSAVESIDKSRTITVEFLATNNESLPWEFKPLVSKVKIHPGANAKLAYFARNKTDHAMTIQAIPSVSPGQAARYIKKTECFCFTSQSLDGGKAVDLPLIFHVDRDLPQDINTLTLSYTIFDITGKNLPTNRS